MPEKKSGTGTTSKQYRCDGKAFVWTTDEGEEVTIPMRVKLKLIRSMANRDMSADVMFEIVESLVPGSADKLDEMDVNDFTRMFVAWQSEYTALSGATLGE